MRAMIFGLLVLCNMAQADNLPQEIRYNCPRAREVFIVWGVSGWQLPPKSSWPEGSFEKDHLVYTPMSQSERGKFTALITQPKGTILDFVFWITRGPNETGTDTWDTNAGSGKDYHAIVSPNTITEIESKVQIAVFDPPGLTDHSKTILLLTALLATAGALAAKFSRTFRRSAAPSRIIMSAATALAIFLCLIRPTVARISHDVLESPLSNTPLILGASVYDLIYVSILTGIFMLLLYLARKRQKAQIFLACSYVVLAVFSLIFSIVNIRVVEMIGKPFNYQWLYYSDFLQSPDAKAAMSQNVSAQYIMQVVHLVVSFIFLALAFATLSAAFTVRLARRWKLIPASVCLVAYVLIAHRSLSASNLTHDRLANPVLAFVASMNPFTAPPELFTMPVEDSLVYKKEKSVTPQLQTKFKNVVMIVLESTAAEYVDPYGSTYGATPHLSRLAENSVIVRNLYAHAPATNLSMVSLLGSVYPWLSYNSLTEEHPEMKIKTISSILNENGYRTAFFNSADNRYQKAGEFLSYRGFDAITDCNVSACSGTNYDVKGSHWEFMAGRDDACTASEMESWIGASDSPFFAMMWTYQTHYPYFYKEKSRMYHPSDSMLNRYLNALHHADSLIGQVVQNLERTGRLDSTLVVIVGDHGEAFGRHGQISHGRMIYEENLHVPCMFYNPGIKASTIDATSGLIDVAPTILSYLGIEEAPEWEGTNILTKKADAKAFFFAPWSDKLFGYREGAYKYIFNASKNTTEMYDLHADPQESRDLSASHPARIETAHQRLAGWAQHVNKKISEITGVSAR